VGPDAVTPGGHRGESRVAASVAAGVVVIAHLLLPADLTVLPAWVLSAGSAVLLVLLLASAPRRHPQVANWTRIGSLVLLGALAVMLATSLGLLVDAIVNDPLADAREVISSALNLWVTSVAVFGLALWELDAGGPEQRHDRYDAPGDLLFSQQARPGVGPDRWQPAFVDYLYVSLTNSMTFGPTDTVPLTARAKMLMGFQAAVSLVIVALVAAWAVGDIAG